MILVDRYERCGMKLFRSPSTTTHSDKAYYNLSQSPLVNILKGTNVPKNSKTNTTDTIV